MTTQKIPFDVDVAIINRNGLKCRMFVRSWSFTPMGAAMLSMDKARANGHKVTGWHSVSRA